MTENEEFTLKYARPRDAEKCNDFYNRIYKKKRPRSGWLWEFAEGRTENTIIPYLYVTSEDGTVVGTQAYIPITFIDSKGEFKTGKSEETLLDPVLRGKGMFRKLYDRLFETCVADEIHGLWGFTPAGGAFRKVGFSTPATVTQLLKPIRQDFADKVQKQNNPQNAQNGITNRLFSVAGIVNGKLRRKPQIDPSVVIKKMESVPDLVTDLSKRFVEQWGGVTIHRSKSYMNWRFTRNPYCNSTIWTILKNDNPVGFGVTSISDDILYLVDLIVTPDSSGKDLHADACVAVDAFLHHASQVCVSANASGLRAWHGSNHPFSMLILERAKKHGWIHYKRGSEIVIWQNDTLTDCRLPGQIDDYYITRAFTEGHQG